MSDIDPDVAATMAYSFEQKIGRIDAKDHPATKMKLTFRDDSRLLFDVSPTPNFKAYGTKYSISNQFLNSIKEFRIVDGGLEFEFQDGSKFSYADESPLHSAR